jgi:predicted AlkP superfamily pyrophosphatase or phosphodiesterase
MTFMSETFLTPLFSNVTSWKRKMEKKIFSRKKYLRKIKFLMLLLLIILFVPIPKTYADHDVERVIIVSIDSMNNNFVFNEFENPDFILTPNIGILVENGASFTDAEAVMPTKTQVNHVTIVSGSYAEKIGVAGNYVFDVDKKSILYWKNYLYPWKHPELIKADTIFKALEREDENYTSAVIAGKNFVGCPIWADIQVGPACISESAKALGILKFPEVQMWDAPDEWVMNNVLLVLEETDPDITLVNLAFLDPVQHACSHGSVESWAALAWADYQIGRLIKYLKDSGKLERTLIILTADHGQSNSWKNVNIRNILRKKDIKSEVVADGPFAHIFLKDKNDMEAAVNFLKSLEAVDGIWYDEGLDDIHIRTPYTGDIVISLKPPYEAFSRVKPPTVGTHGGLQQRFVPLIFFGPKIQRGVILEKAILTDIVPTICEITGYPIPNDSQGKVLQIIDPTQKTAPDIDYVLISSKRYTIGYITSLFLIFSLLCLVPALLLQRQNKYLFQNITSYKLSNIIPYFLLTICLIFAITASIYSYIVNLYFVPGIQPDTFIVTMDFGILGSFIVSILFALIIIWYVPLIIEIFIFKLRGRGWTITTIPLSLFIFIIIQYIYISLNLLIRIPYNYSFHIFTLFFFGGLILSYFIRCLLQNQFIKVFKRKIISGTIISGILNIILWFYLLMFFLFPNYLFSLGFGTIL